MVVAVELNNNKDDATADATVITNTNTTTSTNITSGNSDVKVKDVVKDVKDVKVNGLVKTCIGKPYSVERYYMLSEIEQNAIRPIYLNDYNNNNDSNKNESESDSEFDSLLSLVSPYVILYLLWDFNTFLFSDDNDDDNDDDYDNGAAVESFSNTIIQTAIEKLNRLLLVQVPNTTLTPIPIPPITTTNVYIVVDMLIPSSLSTASASSTASSMDDVAVAVQQKKKQYQRYITIAEELVARTMSSSSDSSSNSNSNSSNSTTTTTTTTIKISGITVGIVNHPRAAPGLESCLDSIMIGSKDRRQIQRQRRRRLLDSGRSNDSCGTSHGINDNLKTRTSTTGSFNNDDKSCITIVCNCLDDLIGFDEEGETDAVQNVFQSRSSSSFYSQEDFDSNENEHEHEHEHEHEPPIIEFAENAHQYWCVHIAGVTTTAEPTIEEEIEIKKYNNDSYYSNNNTSSIKSNTTKYVVVDDDNSSDNNNKLVTVMVWITVLLIGYISYYIGK